MDPFDVISSDDSELRPIDEYKSDDESPTMDYASSRVLPEWASGYSRSNAMDHSPRRSAFSFSSFIRKNVRSSLHPSLGGDSEYEDELPIRDSAFSTQRILPAWASDHSRSYAREPSPKRRAFANGSGSNYNRGNASSSQQTLKRTLPGSFHSSGPSSRSVSLVENVGSSHIRQTHEKSYQSTWSTPKDHPSRGIGALHTGVNDPLHHPGMVDERAAGTDERLIYQAALQGRTGSQHEMAGLEEKKRHELNQLMQILFGNESEEDEMELVHKSSWYPDGGQEHGIGKDESGEKSDNFYAENENENENENGEEANLARSSRDGILY